MSENEEIDIPELKTDFLFRRRPVAIPADLRPAWRIGLLLLLLSNCCRGGRTTLARLHVLGWGIRVRENRNNLTAALAGRIFPNSLLIRFDPYLNQAVDFAIGEGLVRRSEGNKIDLTPKGRKVAEELGHAKEAYTDEKRFMKAIHQRLTESIVMRMFQ